MYVSMYGSKSRKGKTLPGSEGEKNKVRKSSASSSCRRWEKIWE